MNIGLTCLYDLPQYIVRNVLTTGAQPNTSGMTYSGLPRNAKARMMPRAPSAPAAPAARLQMMPVVVQCPASPVTAQQNAGRQHGDQKVGQPDADERPQRAAVHAASAPRCSTGP